MMTKQKSTVNNNFVDVITKSSVISNSHFQLFIQLTWIHHHHHWNHSSLIWFVIIQITTVKNNVPPEELIKLYDETSDCHEYTQPAGFGPRFFQGLGPGSTFWTPAKPIP